MIKITTRGFKLTKGIEGKVESEAGKVDIQGRDLINSNVVLSNHPDGKKAEVSIKINKRDFRVETVDSDLYNAIELSFGKLQEQVRKHLQRKNRFNHRDSIRFETDSIDNDISEDNSTRDLNDSITKRQLVSVKPMSEDEAVLQMKHLEKMNFLFYNTDTNTPCMIYKRGNAEYGIVDSAVTLPDNENYVLN